MHPERISFVTCFTDELDSNVKNTVFLEDVLLHGSGLFLDAPQQLRVFDAAGVDVLQDFFQQISSLRFHEVILRRYAKNVNWLQMPRRPHWHVHQPVGLLVADDLLLDRIEIDRAAHADGDVAQMQSRGGAVRRFGSAARFLACPDRFAEGQ